MICPHCEKPIKLGITPEALARAKELRAAGYSFRDIEAILRGEKMIISFATLSRHLKQKPKRKPK